MDSSLSLSNLLNPPVLFFFMGMFAVFLGSDLENPQPLPKLFFLYLLFAMGFKGGHEIHESGISGEIAITLLAAIALATILSIYAFFILKLTLDGYNAVAIAATYGLISAVTFVTASTFLERLDITSGGHMVAALALMKSPAIIIGIVLVRLFSNKQDAEESILWSEVLRESCLNGSVFLLMGSLLVSIVTSQRGWESLETFTGDIFYGVLTFFLLDMGIVAARQVSDLKKSGSFLIGFSVSMPIFNALLGIGIAAAIGMSVGNALLFSVLAVSAS